MSPPKKKKKTAPKTANSFKTATRGTTGKGGSGGRHAPNRDALEEKRARPKQTRKKKRGYTAEYLALAFFLGLVFASVLFLALRQQPDKNKATTVAGRENAQVSTAPATSPPSPLRKIPPEQTRQARQKEPANQTSSLEKNLGQHAVLPPAPPFSAKTKPEGQSPAPEVNETFTPQPALSPEKSGKPFSSARIDPNAPPYEEAPNIGLDERIRQVDYALMQAAWLKKLPASAMRLLRVEDRLEDIEPYHYQTIDILPGQSSKPFVSALGECLEAWAEGARLHKKGPEEWTVLIRDIPTHRIRFHPGKTTLPPLEGASLPEFAPDEGLPARRLRKPGEEAKLTIVIDDLGASSVALETLLSLDYPVTFAFWPHGAHTRAGARAAHAAGREVLAHQPMEPLGYPKVKPGPNVLLVDMDEEQIRAALKRSLDAVPYAVGLNNHMGSRFTQHGPGVDVVLAVLKERGLFMLDSLTHNRSVFLKHARRFGLRHYGRNVFLDAVPTRENALAELRQAERIAMLTGQAVAIGHPLPETLAALKDWSRLRDKKVRIVPLRELNDN